MRVQLERSWPCRRAQLGAHSIQKLREQEQRRVKNGPNSNKTKSQGDPKVEIMADKAGAHFYRAAAAGLLAPGLYNTSASPAGEGGDLLASGAQGDEDNTKEDSNPYTPISVIYLARRKVLLIQKEHLRKKHPKGQHSHSKSLRNL
jgi:hypothetical protein